MSDTMKDAVVGLQKKKIMDLKKSKVRLEQEVSSIRDRVRDIEWRIEGSADGEGYNSLMNERQRALDKLRETQKELLVVREQLIEAGVE